jgi:hypothetical protein
MHGFIQPNQQQSTTGFGHSVQQSGGFGHGQPDRFAQQSSSNTGFGQQSSSNTGFGQQSSSNTGFGQPPSFRPDASAVGGFSQAPAGGFGGWGGGQQQQQQQGFGQFPVQNGGFSSATGFGGQTMPTSYGNTMSAPSGQFSDKMGVTGGGFGAFSMGQPGGMQPAASANPFMVSL